MPIFSNLPQSSRLFYAFSGVHSFLIGLFPFFMPVFLWKQGFSLNQISMFIAITGLGFCLTLRLWESVFPLISFEKIIILSFFLEVILVGTFFLQEKSLFLLCAASVNGIYSCLFWIPQRFLFIETVSWQNTGRKFGNFQIFVFLLLKAGILTGGLFLENLNFFALYLITLVVNLLAIFYFLTFEKKSIQREALSAGYRPMSSKDIICWRDNAGSKAVFAIDGIFLYLESYFWALSLFIIAKENFRDMALLVILLAFSFGLIFYVLKNNIDTMSPRPMYRLAVVLYLLSWLLRGAITHVQGAHLLSGTSVAIILILITFFTGFFRLAFNKRFFEHAKGQHSQRYILKKSYYSQFCIALFFALFSKIYHTGINIESLLQNTYWPAAMMALLYLNYSQHNTKNSSIQSNPLNFTGEHQ